MPSLRPLAPADLPELVAVYRDAVLSQTPGRYSPAQVQAWADHASRSDALADALRQGRGLASCSPAGIEAFGVLAPADRLALLYCRGRACRQGRASAILAALEAEASAAGIRRLRTEASQLSRPLLARRGWQVEAEETVLFGGAWFQRWRMIKAL